jgi:outer membrane protein
MKMRKIISCILLLVAGFSGYAQTDSIADKKLWTLKECVDYALANSLTVKRGELTVESSEIDLRQSKWNRLPSLNAQSNYGYNWGRGLDPTTNQFVSSQQNTVGDVGVNANVTLFNSMRVNNSIKQYEKTRDASEQDLLKSRNDVSLNVTTLFINVVFNKELLENAKFQLASSQQQLERTKKQVAAGALPRSEELNLDAQVATNELNVINQTNTLTLSLLQLQQALQIPASREFDVEIPVLDPENLVLDQSREDVYTIAQGVMPEIKSSVLKVESSDYAIKAARGNLYPRLSLGGSMNTTYSKSAESKFVPDGVTVDKEDGPIAEAYYDVPNNLSYPVYGYRSTGSFQDIYLFNDQVKDNLYKSVRLTLTIPIFNNYTARAALQRSLIQNEQAKISKLEVENTLRQNVETAFNDALAASKSYEQALKQVRARDEAFRMTKQRYEIGAVNYVEYQVAENNLFQARTDLARAKYNFIFRKKLLDFYQGKPIGL